MILLTTFFKQKVFVNLFLHPNRQNHEAEMHTKYKSQQGVENLS